MRAFTIVTYILFLLWALIIATCNVTFGYGLGDIAYLVAIAAVFILLTIYFLMLLAKRFANNISCWLFIALTLAAIIYFSLEATIFRGTEYPWNGSVFYGE